MSKLFERTSYTIMTLDRKSVVVKGKWGLELREVKTLRANSKIQTYPQKAMAERVLNNNFKEDVEVVAIKERWGY